MQLSTDQCHLFAASTDEIRDQKVREHFAGLLDATERERCTRFRTDALQARYTLAHGLLRQTLGEYTASPPADLRFARDERNRPTLEPPHRFDFNLSYTTDLIAFAIASVGQLGCDVERVDRRVDWLALAPRVLTATELAHLKSLTSDRARCAFFEIWVLKEAYAKALGIGIEMAFNAYTLMHVDGELITDVDAAGWQFGLYAHDEYRVAIATDRPATVDWRHQRGTWSELARRTLDRQEL